MEGNQERTDKLITFLKIVVIILFLIAIGMGAWLLISRLFDKEGGDTPTAENIELDWWILWESEDDLQVIADAYEAENPNVTINIRNQLRNQYKEKLLDQIRDGVTQTGPDIVRIHNTWVPLFEDYLVPLPSSVMTESEYSSTFYPTASNDFQGSDGKLYAMPMMFDGLGVYYNKDILKDNGYTVPEDDWDAFLTQAQALTSRNANEEIVIAGVGMGTANNVDFSFDILSLLMLQEGAEIVNSQGTTFADDPEEKVARAVKYYTDYATRYGVWDSTLPRDITMFSEGRLGMMFAPSWRVFDIETAIASEGAELDYDIAPVPQQPNTEGSHINWADYWAEAVSSESENPEVAWDFLKFVTEQEQLKAFNDEVSQYREFGEIYPRPDMKNEILQEKYVGAYVKMAPTARSWNMVDKEKVSSEFNSFIDEVASGGDTSVGSIQSRLGDLASAVDQIITNAQ